MKMPFIIPILIFFIGCNDKYQLCESKGQMYRVDKISGKTELIENGHFNEITPHKKGESKLNDSLLIDSLFTEWEKEPPKEGTIRDGYKYIGGDYKDSSNWRLVGKPWKAWENQLK